MTWFEALMGFEERSPEHVRANLAIEGTTLVSAANGRRVGCGRLETPSLSELRRDVASSAGREHARVSEAVGDVAAMHRDPANAGALFQAASQFNLLEMAHPSVTPEQGVGRYEMDATQGPACAISCGGGTIYRNYFVPLGDALGQTATRQIDCLRELGDAIGPKLWEMRNGYALASAGGLASIEEHLARVDEVERDRLRGLLRVGVQHDVEVLGTDHVVTQVYGAAMPVSYGQPRAEAWEPVARLVLEASYEATFLIARQRGIDTVYLTLLGGGAFGNRPSWIADSISRALEHADGLDVRIVSYGRPNPTVASIVEAHRAAMAARRRR